MTSFSKLSRFEFADDGITKMKIIQTKKGKRTKDLMRWQLSSGAVWTANESENGCRLFVQTQNTTNRDDDSVVDNRKNIYYGARMPPPFGRMEHKYVTQTISLSARRCETVKTHRQMELKICERQFQFESLMMPSCILTILRHRKKKTPSTRIR